MLNSGDRVLARWPVEVDWWYPGVVVGAEGPLVVVQFDDGDRAALDASLARPLDGVGVGRRVYGRFRGGTYYFPGAIAARTGAAIHIVYDDGDTEWTSVGMVRVHRDDVPAL